MTPGDVARLLGTCALYDYRETSKHDAVAWWAVIGDLDFADANEAVVRHYRESIERIMPAHVRAIVRQIRDERRRAEQQSERQALPSRFEERPERQLQIEQGVATAREVLGPVLAHLAAQSPPPSALEELRELTAGPADTIADGEVQS